MCGFTTPLNRGRTSRIGMRVRSGRARPAESSACRSALPCCPTLIRSHSSLVARDILWITGGGRLADALVGWDRRDYVRDRVERPCSHSLDDAAGLGAGCHAQNFQPRHADADDHHVFHHPRSHCLFLRGGRPGMLIPTPLGTRGAAAIVLGGPRARALRVLSAPR